MSKPFSAASTDASTSATNGSLLKLRLRVAGLLPEVAVVIAGPPSVSCSSTTRSRAGEERQGERPRRPGRAGHRAGSWR